MTTALMVLGAVILVLVLVGVLYQMTSSPLMWFLHFCNDTVGKLLLALWWCVAGVFEAITGSNG